jgi:hypothetical protein
MFTYIQVAAQCEYSPSSANQLLGENFITDPNFLEAEVAPLDSLLFEALWLGNNTYRIATNNSEKEKLNIKLFDENNNLLFDNSEFGLPDAWTFFVENSMKVNCVVRRIESARQPNCITILTGFKK